MPACLLICPLGHSFARSFAHLTNCLLIFLLVCSFACLPLIFLLICSFFCLFAHLPVCSLICPLACLFAHLLAYLHICSLICPLANSFSRSFTHLPACSLICKLVRSSAHSFPHWFAHLLAHDVNNGVAALLQPMHYGTKPGRFETFNHSLSKELGSD